jgi:hypothetical protein
MIGSSSYLFWIFQVGEEAHNWRARTRKSFKRNFTNMNDLKFELPLLDIPDRWGSTQLAGENDGKVLNEITRNDWKFELPLLDIPGRWGSTQLAGENDEKF